MVNVEFSHYHVSGSLIWNEIHSLITSQFGSGCVVYNEFIMVTILLKTDKCCGWKWFVKSGESHNHSVRVSQMMSLWIAPPTKYNNISFDLLILKIIWMDSFYLQKYHEVLSLLDISNSGLSNHWL